MSRCVHDPRLPLAAAALLCAAAAPLPERGSRLNFGGQSEFGLPVASLIGRRFETVVGQQYDYSCGSAALATLLRFHYGDAQTEQSVFVGMFRDGDRTQIRRLGFSLLDMKRYLASRGIAADGYRITLAQLAAARTPGIALIDYEGYKHFVVVKGIEGGSLILGDPSLGLRRESARTFGKQWNGVFFVLNGRQTVATAHFNDPADLARAPRGVFQGGGRPLDLAALALTRPIVLPAPLPREF